MAKGLTAKQKLFIEHYLDCLNATRAAELAGYKGSYSTLAAIGSQNLRKLNIMEEIKAGLEEKAMPREEVLARLSEMARADLSDFVLEDDEGYALDWNMVRRRGYLIKSITRTTKGIRLELHDSSSALVQIGRVYAMFTDKLEVDWERELMEAGITPGDEFEQLVQHITTIGTSKEEDAG